MELSRRSNARIKKEWFGSKQHRAMKAAIDRGESTVKHFPKAVRDA